MLSEDIILKLYEITDVIIAGLSTGSVYALMAVGMTLVYGVTKAFNFAYGDFGRGHDPGLWCDQGL
jgi:branched-chain amino acid transport system permease protein